MKIGVISDTHGLLRDVAQAALKGSDLIIHAGDVGKESVLADLAALAPVIAVRGNCDKGEWAACLPETQLVQAEQARIFMLHDLKMLGRHGLPEGVVCIVSGHTHSAAVRQEGGILYLNPGSAGPRRFALPLTVALLTVENGVLHPEIVTLEEF